MKIFGLDFTSAPGRQKALTYSECLLEGEILSSEYFGELRSFEEMENFLNQPGPWVMGLDFPFGQPRKLIENLGWPGTWEAYVGVVSGMSKAEFDLLLASYRASQPKGDKQHLRRTDELANSRSPMMMYGVPVGKMFFEGAQRLLNSGASILPCCKRNDPRVVLEAYPALVARHWVDRCSYKSDNKRKQTLERQSAREEIVRGLRSRLFKSTYGFDVHFGEKDARAFIQDGSGDRLDALLCALQAGWSYTKRDCNYGIPVDCDPLEGWIVDPVLIDLINQRQT